MTGGARGRAALGALYWGAAALMAMPLLLLALTSVSGPAVVGFPLGAATWRWFAAALDDADVRRAALLSAALAAGSAALAVAAGTCVALAARTLRTGWMRAAFLAAAMVPLITPGIVHAVALRVAVRVIGLPPGPLAILLGHAIHATPYAVIMVGARRATLPPELLDAARDLGAGETAALRCIVLPWLRPALFAAGMLAGLTSFDDFIRSYLLGGYDATLPVLMFARLRAGLAPETGAIATLAWLLACAAGVVAGTRGPRQA